MIYTSELDNIIMERRIDSTIETLSSYIPKIFKDFEVYKILKAKIYKPKNSHKDYPGKKSYVLELPSCDMQCPFCNKFHVIFNVQDEGMFSFCLVEELVDAIIKGKVKSLTVTGGEPLLFDNTIYVKTKDFILFIIQICHTFKIPIKINTNGANYEFIKWLYTDASKFYNMDMMPDWISVDFKTSRTKYIELFTEGTYEENKIKIDNVFRTIAFFYNMIMHDLKPERKMIEFIMLPMPGFIDIDIVKQMATCLPTGARWRFKPYCKLGPHYDSAYDNHLKEIFSDEDIDYLVRIASRYVFDTRRTL